MQTLAVFGIAIILAVVLFTAWKVIRMSDALDRITASVTRVSGDISTVADQIRSHPAAADDSGALNALADKLDAASGELESVATPAAPAPTPADPAAPAA